MFIERDFFIDSNTIYPNWTALLPTLASTCLLAASRATINQHLLGCPPLTLLGKLSYSLYLWHWPPLAFTFITLGREAGLIVYLLIFAATLVFALISYHLIEKPARYSKKNIAPFLLTALLCLGCFGFVNYQHAFIYPSSKALADTDSKEGKFFIKAMRSPNYFYNLLEDRERKISTDHCQFSQQPSAPLTELINTDPCLKIPHNKKPALILGDSFANDTYGAMRLHFPNTHLIRPIQPRCQVSIYFYRDEKADCRHYIRSSGISTIIIAMQWHGYHDDLQPDIDALIEDGHHVIIIGPGVEFNDWVYNIFSRRKSEQNLTELIKKNIRPDRFELNATLQQYYQQRSIPYIDRLAMFCSSLETCQLLNEEGELYIVDWGHLFTAGQDFFGRQLAKHPALQHLH